MAFLCFGLVFF